MGRRLLSILRFLYDIQDSWALLGVAIVLAANLSRVSRWVRELNTVETVALVIGSGLCAAWLLLRLVSIARRVTGETVSVTRPGTGSYVSLALHGQGGIQPGSYATGPGGFELIYRRWQPLEIQRISVIPQLRFGDEQNWSTSRSIAVQPLAVRETFRSSGWDREWIPERETGIWNLGGLPVVIQANGALPLPGFSLRVTNVDGAISEFTEHPSATLNLRFSVYTNAGFYTPQMSIPVVMQEPPPPTPDAEASQPESVS
jgi:hypothetical protein